MLKSGVATFGLLLQITLFELFGSTFTGEVNRLQMWALLLSFLVLPGIEFSILRLFPRLRSELPAEYDSALTRAQNVAIKLSLVLFIALFFTAYFASEAIASIAVVVTLSFLFFLARVLPVIHRWAGKARNP